jgi:hypothetical protein
MKEIYLKIKEKSELPTALLSYVYKDFDNVIHIGRTLTVDFKEDEKNIRQMEELATRPGFMFFVNSEEGEKWLRDNPITINCNNKK